MVITRLVFDITMYLSCTIFRHVHELSAMWLSTSQARCGTQQGSFSYPAILVLTIYVTNYVDTLSMMGVYMFKS